MAHHNFEMRDAVRKVFGEHEQELGATGKYPDGSYSDRDEGEIRFAVAADPDRQVVLVDFGKPVHSLGMTPDQAIELADLIHRKAWECRGIAAT